MIIKIIVLILLSSFGSGITYDEEIISVYKSNFTPSKKYIQILNNELSASDESNIIKDDTFKCVNSRTVYNITYYPQKKYIYLLTNDTNNVYLHGRSLKIINSDLNFYEIDGYKKLEIFASESKKICFELMFQEKKNHFILNPKQKMTFNLVDANYFLFDFINLKKNYNNIIKIESEKNNLKIKDYTIDNKEQEYKNNEINFINSGEIVEFELPVYIKNIYIIDKLTVYIEQISENRDEKKEENKDEKKEDKNNYEGLIKFATYCAYVCFGIILLPIALLVFFTGEGACIGLFTIFFGGVGIFPTKKFGSVYLCKRYENKVNNK